MRIEGVTQINYDVFRDFCHFNVLGKNKYAKLSRVLCFIMYIILSAFLLFEIIFHPKFTYYFSLGYLVFIPLVIFVPIHFTIKKQYKQTEKFSGTPVQFLFDDDCMKICKKPIDYNEFKEIEYEALDDIYETKKYFYFYLTKYQANILAKSGITQGTPEQLSAFLSHKVGYKFKKR